jgi:response regulator RpfG family c-di-GMP phosphodiesterase
MTLADVAELVRPAKAAESPRVLVVDDETVICDILRDFLEFEGFHVTTAHSGEEAVEKMKLGRFDLLLTDLKMPGMGGLDLLHRLSDAESDTMTIIMTGYGTVETAIEAMKKGAFDYILKPFKPEDVVRVLRRGLEKQRLLRENFALRESVGFYELSEALSSAMPLDEQLQMILAMVAENFGAEACEIIIEDPKNPGTYVQRAAVGACMGGSPFGAKVSYLFERFLAGERIMAHGEEIAGFIDKPATAEYEVHAFMAAALRIRGAPFGLLNAYCLKPKQRLTEGHRKGLAIFAARAANAIDAARMYGNLSATFTQTIEGFARALEAKDNYTHGHSDRVAMYSRLIGETMGLPAKTVESIEHGGLMHDIGKIGIRSNDLNKPQKLTPNEYEMFKSHPVVGKRIIEPITFLSHLVPCVYHHHEAYDGSGYPEGLGGKDIPLAARILAVADSYDAMTSNRPYRKALPHDIALAEFKRCAGRQFDPEVVEAFLSVIDRFRGERRARGLPVPD